MSQKKTELLATSILSYRLLDGIAWTLLTELVVVQETMQPGKVSLWITHHGNSAST